MQPQGLLSSASPGPAAGTSRHCLLVAGVRFVVTSDGPSLEERREPAYREFTGTAARARATTTFPVGVTVAPQPDFSRAETLFAGDGSWSLRRRDGERWIVGGAPDGAPPAWAARIDAAAAEVRCRPEQIRRSRGRSVLDNPLRYPLDQLLLLHALSGPDAGVIVHAGGAVCAGRGFLFGGVSGAGKTTLARLLEAHGGFELLSDDRVVVRKTAGDFLLWGTPWAGEGGFARNVSAPLRGLFFLAKGPTSRQREISPSAALRRLLPLASIPWFDRERLGSPLDCLAELTSGLPAFELAFAVDDGAAGILERCCDAIASV